MYFYRIRHTSLVCSVCKQSVCVCVHILILDVKPSFFQDICVDGFHHITAVLTSVELPEELGFCCANHHGKVLERQQSLSSVAARIY